MISNKALTINAIACLVLFAMLVFAQDRDEAQNPDKESVNEAIGMSVSK